jgi:hypothetical protein
MKRCDNCFEVNSDGATNCVICGEPMDVPQLEADVMAMSVAVSPPAAEDRAPLGATQAGRITEVIESQEEEAAAEPDVEEDPTAALEADESAAAEPEDELEAAGAPGPDEFATTEPEDELEAAAALEADEFAAAELEEEPEAAAVLEPDEFAAAEPEDEPEVAAAPEPDEFAADELEVEQETAAALEADEFAAAEPEEEPEAAAAPGPDESAAAKLEDEQEPAAAFEPDQVPAAGPGEVSVEPDATPATSPVPTAKPVNGQAVLQVFHNTEPRVVYSHPVVNDVTLIGREDPQRDVFPDLDLGKLTDQGVSVSRVSRQHLRLLRQGDRYFLFIYRGSTGTQVNKELVDESHYGKRFEIDIGDRIILGGQVRLKLAAGM